MREDYTSSERKTQGNAEWPRLGGRLQSNSRKNQKPGWRESKTRVGRSNADLSFEAPIASRREMSRHGNPDRFK